MSFFDALRASASGLNAQSLRMKLISGNLANMHTTRTPDGGPYRRKEAVFAAQEANTTFKDILAAQRLGEMEEVQAVAIVQDERDPIYKYDPDHPDADENGRVAYPNISLAEEMVDLITATRSYEANVAAIKATKSMVMKALEIGR
jgi:flagellar basal-body rod protein FlgC